MRLPLILFYNSFFTTFFDTGGRDCLNGCEPTTGPVFLPEADALIIHLPSCEKLWAAPKYQPAADAPFAALARSSAGTDLAPPWLVRAKSRSVKRHQRILKDWPSRSSTDRKALRTSSIGIRLGDRDPVRLQITP